MSESENNLSVDIVVPDIGDSENVEVIELLVAVGDSVSVDDSLITLESDKASMEIPASQAGVIESFTVSIGDTVTAGDVIGRLRLVTTSTPPAPAADNGAELTATAPSIESKTPAPEPSVAPTAKKELSIPVGSAPNKPTNAQSKSSGSPTAHIADADMRKAHASPGVRRYAREHGADLSLIQGSGTKGRIVKTDVMAFIKKAMEGMNSNYGSSGGFSGGGTGIPAIPEVDFSKFGEIERVELGRINKISAANLHRAWLNLPMVTHHDSADITEMEAFRKLLKNETKEGDAKITGLAFHMKALAKTLKAFPKVNSSISVDGEALFYKKYFHIGIAVDTPNGLVVPVFKDVDKKTISELAAEMLDMSTRARAKKLKPDEMQGASMTISSLGGIG
ncbi:MAG: pyruvate dehydrogenase E2 component (dihydrolipoamide acetyltransferase), partial [bacterium]